MEWGWSSMELIPKSKITVPDWGLRYTDDVHFEPRISASLKRFGQMLPLVVRQVDDDKYEIVDGRRRWEAMEALPGDDIWVFNIGPVTRAEAIKRGLALSLSAEIDYAALAKHVVDELKEDPEYNSLPSFTFLTAERIQYFQTLLNFDWSIYEEQYESLLGGEFGLDDAPPPACLLYTSPSPRDRQKSRMPSSA